MEITQANIAELEERLRQAMLQSDIRVLDELVATELIFTNHLGQVFNKQDDLAAHRSGALKIMELTPSQQKIQIHKGFAIVSVLMHVIARYMNAQSDLNLRYTRVWARASNGNMQIVAGQASIVQTQGASIPPVNC